MFWGVFSQKHFNPQVVRNERGKKQNYTLKAQTGTVETVFVMKS